MANLNLELTDTEAAADLNPLSQNANSGPQYVVRVFASFLMGTGLKTRRFHSLVYFKIPTTQRPKIKTQRKCMCSTTSVVQVVISLRQKCLTLLN